MDEALFRHIEAGATVVTATRRLAREIGAAHDAWQRHQGREVWTTGDVLPMGAWLRRAWQQSWSELILPADSQAEALWQTVIQDDLAGRQGGALLEAARLAPVAVEAGRLVAAYRMPAEGWTEEERAFLRWHGRFRRRCAELGWIDPATVVDRVAASVAAGTLRLPGTMVMAGFDRLAPAEQALLAGVAEAGTAVDTWAPRRSAGRAVRVAAPDPAGEVAACARWLRERWFPGARLAVVVPDLAERRTVIERLFTAELAPAAVLPGAPRQRAFDLSLGPPLAHNPLVAAALTALHAAAGPQPFATAAALLTSPFLGENEAIARARGELALRRRGPEVTLAELVACAAAGGAAATAERLRRLARALPASTPAPPGRWAAAFIAALEAVGWPGPRTLDGAEVQARAAFYEAMAALAALAPALPRLSLSAAVDRLAGLCAHPFQPEGGEAPVQVLGPLEAAGLAFDGAWLMGLDAHTLPAPPRLHPLLPAALQQRLDLPHATAHGELVFARNLMERLLCLAPEVVASHPCHVGDAPRAPSPLILSLPVGTLPDGPSASLLAATLGWGAVEEVADAALPPLPAGTAVRGGARVLEDQARCPFRAAATHRLAAQLLVPVEEEPSPRTRGTLVHRCLERLWAALADQAALMPLTAEQRGELCREIAVDEVSRSRLSRSRHPVVVARLATLLEEWLVVEASRSPFAVVAHERAVVAEIGGLHLDLRVDRLDRLPDGRLVVIDYKTGEVRRGDWWGERPAGPQLPLYAATVGPAVAAVAFGRVRPGRCVLVGVGDADVGPDVVALDKASGCPAGTWAELLGQWRAAVESLAADFARGVATLDPLRDASGRPVACRHCDLPILCRIHETQPTTDAESE